MEDTDDFHTLKRRDLQSLCKKHHIPANLTNLEMANRLTQLLKVKEKQVVEKLDVVSEIESDQVRFSPDNEVLEFTGERKTSRMRYKRMSSVQVVKSYDLDTEFGVGEKVLAETDLRGMKRRELQGLCKKHKVPANLKSEEMVNRLVELFKEKVKDGSEEVMIEKDENMSEYDEEIGDMGVRKKPKKVKFSPEHEVIEFTRQRATGRGRRSSVLSRNSKVPVVNVNGAELCGDKVGRIVRKRKGGVVNEIAEEEVVGEPPVLLRRSSRRGNAVESSEMEVGGSQVEMEGFGAKIESGEKIETVPQNQDTVKVESRRSRRKSVFLLQEQKEITEGCGAKVDSGAKLETVTENQKTMKVERRSSRRKSVFPSREQVSNYENESKKQKNKKVSKSKVGVTGENSAGDDSHIDQKDSQVVPACIASVSEVAESINLADLSRNNIVETSKLEMTPLSVMNSSLEMHEEKSDTLQKSHTYCRKENYDMVVEKANLSPEADVHDLVEESTCIAHNNGDNATQVVSLTDTSSFCDTADCDEVMEASDDFSSAAFAKTSLSTYGTSTKDDQAYFKSELEVMEGELDKCIELSLDLVDVTDETKCVPTHENHDAVEPVCMDDNIPAIEFVGIDHLKVLEIRPEEKNGDIVQRTIHKSMDQTFLDEGYKALSQSVDISDVNIHVSEGEIDSTVLETDLGLAQPSAAKLMIEKRDCLLDSNRSACVKEVSDEYASARDSNGYGLVHEISNVVDIFLKDHIEVGLDENEVHFGGGQSATRVSSLSEAIACDHYCSKDVDISTGRTKSEAENDLQGASDTLYGFCEDAEEGRFVDIGHGSMSGGKMSSYETVRGDEHRVINIDDTQKAEERKSASTDDVYVTESCEAMLVDTVCSDISGKKMSMEEITRDDEYETLKEADENFNIDSAPDPDSENRFQASVATLLNNEKCIMEEKDSLGAHESCEEKYPIINMDEEDTHEAYEKLTASELHNLTSSVTQSFDVEAKASSSAGQTCNEEAIATSSKDNGIGACVYPCNDAVQLSEVAISPSDADNQRQNVPENKCDFTALSMEKCFMKETFIDGVVASSEVEVAMDYACGDPDDQIGNDEMVLASINQESSPASVSGMKEGEIDSTVLETDLGLAQPSAAKLMIEKRDEYRAEEEIPDKALNSDLAKATEDFCLLDSNGSACVKEVSADYASAGDNGDGLVHEISNVVDIFLKDHMEVCLYENEVHLGGGQSATRVSSLSESIVCDHYCSKVVDISTGRTKSEAENDLKGAIDTLYGFCEDAEEGRFVDIGHGSMSGGKMSSYETVQGDEHGVTNIDGTQKPESCEAMLVDIVYSDISGKKISMEEITKDDEYETLKEADENFNIDSAPDPDSENRFQASMATSLNNEKCIMEEKDSLGAHESCEEKYPIINMDEEDTHEAYEKLTASELHNLTSSVTQSFDVEAKASSSTGQRCNEEAIATSSQDNGSGACVYPCNDSVQLCEVVLGPSNCDNQTQNVPENKCDFTAMSMEKSVMKETFIDAVASSEVDVPMDNARGEPVDEIGKEYELELLFATPVKSKDSWMHDETSTGSERTLNSVSCTEATCPVGDDIVIENNLDSIDRVPGSDNEKITDDEMVLASINQESSPASVAGKKENELQLLFATPINCKASCVHDYMPAGSKSILQHRSCKEYVCSMEENVVIENRSDDIDVGTSADKEVVDASSVLASACQSSCHPPSVAGKGDNELHLMSATPVKIDDSWTLNDTSGGSRSILGNASHKDSLSKMKGNIVIQESNDIDVVTGPDYQKTVDESSVLSTTNQGSNTASVEGKEENELQLLLLTPSKFEATCVIDEISAGSECTLKDVSSIDCFCSMDDSLVAQIKSDKINGGSGAEFVKHGSSSSTFFDHYILDRVSVEGEEENVLRLLFGTPNKMESSCRVDEASGSERTLEDTSCIENDVSMKQGMSCEKIGKTINTTGGLQVTSQAEVAHDLCDVNNHDLSCKEAGFYTIEENIVIESKLDDVDSATGSDNEKTVDQSSIMASASAYFTENEFQLLFATPVKCEASSSSGPGNMLKDATRQESFGTMEDYLVSGNNPDDTDEGTQTDYEKAFDGSSVLASSNQAVLKTATLAGEEGLELQLLFATPSKTQTSHEVAVGFNNTEMADEGVHGICSTEIVSRCMEVAKDGSACGAIDDVTGEDDGSTILGAHSNLVSNSDGNQSPSNLEKSCQEICELENRPNKSALTQFSTAKKKARTILIHGTPRKPLVKSGDMKENASMMKNPPAGDITTMRPAKRRPLQDI